MSKYQFSRKLSLLLQGFKYIAMVLLSFGLVISSAIIVVILYLEISRTNGENDPAPYLAQNSRPISIEAPIETNSEDRLSAPRPPFIRIVAPVIKQYPELYNGCEVTTLAMLLQFGGVNKDKMELASEMKIDPTPIEYNPDGTIAYWGHPDTGFVGDVTGSRIGFGIYAEALLPLLEQYIPEAVNMTGQVFSSLEDHIAKGIPVIVWTTVDFSKPADDQWVTWNSPKGPFQTTFKEHTVLLVGYDQQNVYVNDPRQGTQNVKVNKEQFIQSWIALGRQAITYK